MYIWLDFISKTGHVTYYYIPTNFSQKLSPKKRDKNKLRRHITDPPSPPNLLHSLWMPPYCTLNVEKMNM